MDVAIYYHPEAYTIGGTKLMGRNAAGESFLRGFFAHSTSRELWVQVTKPEHAKQFATTAQDLGRRQPVHAVDKHSLAALKQVGMVYHPGPGIGDHAFQRAAFGHNSWSLCGITHTTSSAGAMDALANLISDPLQTWDALICTSNAVKDNVTRLLQAQANYLEERLGITRLVLPQLPVIPIGIHTKDFEFSADQKAAARAQLGVGEQTLVVLYMGRLSFHAKAHPLAMYQALELACSQTSKELVLIECGWHANEFIKKAYSDAANVACPSVRVISLDGRDAQDRQRAWAAADIFCSLSDNIQETFGITPVEAMAAKLPVVVSDWNGYRDTVRDAVDGFRISTLMPKAGLAGDLAVRHSLEIDSYDMYCGYTCSLIAVDVQAAAQAFTRLIESAELREKMGQAGRQRARELYDWATIIPQYEDLWAQLNQLRTGGPIKQTSLQHPWPARTDPFHTFAGYPTSFLTPEIVLSLVDADVNSAMERARVYRQLAMIDFAKMILPDSSEVDSVILIAASGPTTAEQLVAGISQERRPFVFRALSWLLKIGVLKVVP